MKKVLYFKWTEPNGDKLLLLIDGVVRKLYKAKKGKEK